MFEKFVLHHINLNGSCFIFIKIRSFVVAEPLAAASGGELGHLKSSYLDFVISDEKSASPKKNVGLNLKQPV